MKKGILVLGMALAIVLSLQAASHYGFTSNGFEPSAKNLAMGGSPIGAANIWHNDPLAAYANPAIPSLHPGFSYSSTKYDYQKIHYSYSGTDEYLAFSSALASFSYKGIGLLFPSINISNSEYGSYTDYGSFDVSGEDHFEGYSVEMHDQARPFGLSVNLPEAIKLVHPESSLFPASLDLAIGLNIIQNTSKIHPIAAPMEKDASSVDLGLLTRLKLNPKSKFRVESAFGMSYFNAFNSEVSYLDNQQADLIYQRMNLGLGISGAMINQKYTEGRGLDSSFENLCTIRAFAGVLEEFADDPLILGVGAELGALDTIFLRTGYHYDKAGKIDGLTYGLGINLHYRNLFSVSYDHSRFPGGVIGIDKKVNSYGLSFDLIGVINTTALGNN